MDGNTNRGRTDIWAPSSEFVSSSIPSWQILTAHAGPFRGVRDLAFCLKVPLDSLLIWASSEGSGETARMRRLAWTFAARIGIGDKYQIRLSRSIYRFFSEIQSMSKIPIYYFSQTKVQSVKHLIAQRFKQFVQETNHIMEVGWLKKKMKRMLMNQIRHATCFSCIIKKKK